MIDKIFCESYDCAHNNMGACASGMIDVKTYVDSAYVAAYCNSFAIRDSLRDMVSQNMPYSGGYTEIPVRNMGRSEQNTREVVSEIGCTARECVHNSGGLCGAYSIHIEEPHQNGSTLSFCDTYEKPE